MFTEPQKSALYGPDLTLRTRKLWSRVRTGRAPAKRGPARDPLDQMMYVDLRLWLPDDLLLVGDKMSMAESVEMRVPFLDPALVDLVESLPS